MTVSEIKAMCDFDVTDEPFVEKDCVKKFNDCMEQLISLDLSLQLEKTVITK